jgi:hypothetical protein
MPTITVPRTLPKKLLAFFSFPCQIHSQNLFIIGSKRPAVERRGAHFPVLKHLLSILCPEIDLPLVQMNVKDTKAKFACSPEAQAGKHIFKLFISNNHK